MVSFKRISSLCCVLAMVFCFVGLAIPVSAADYSSVLHFDFVGSFDDGSFSYSGMFDPDLIDETFELVFFDESGSPRPILYFSDPLGYEFHLQGVDETVVRYTHPVFNGNIDDLISIFMFYVDGSYKYEITSSYVLPESFDVTVSSSPFSDTESPLQSFFLDLGDVASSSLGLVSSVVSTIVNNPFLLLTVGFFFAGAAVAIFGRILGRS